MTSKILLTSFDTWLCHQKSNASDDLLGLFLQNPGSEAAICLRKLPVDPERAAGVTLTKIVEVKPDAVICCGMAESRAMLTIESTACCGDQALKTAVDLDALIQGLGVTEISHEAGKFVCESLYHSVLNFLKKSSLNIPCIFVHVPIITPANEALILTDFLRVFQRIQQLAISNNSQVFERLF